MHRHPAPGSSYRLIQTHLVRQEGDHLLERLRGISEKHPVQMVGDLTNPPPGLSLRHLSRKLTKSIPLQSGERLVA